MFFAIEIQTSGVYVSPHSQSLIALSESLIRDRKIALNDKQVVFRYAKAPLHRQLGLLHGQRVLIVFSIL